MEASPDPKQHLLRLMFSESSSEVLSISPRLSLWSDAFDRWLASPPISHEPKYLEMATRAWKLLLAFTGCPPWAIDRAQIDAWLEQLAKDGPSRSTIKHHRGMVSSFYHFCAKQPDMQASEPRFSAAASPFNPVLEAIKLRQLNYQAAYILTAEEARRLLHSVDRETSLLGKRDYAFLLTLLTTGLAEKELRNLRWGDLTVAPEKVEIASPDPKKVRCLPLPAWEAILSYLRGSGRLDSIQPGDYIFAPQADPLLHPPSGQPDDWIGDRPISHHQAYSLLKVYAAWAGLDAEKVDFYCLRHTAASLRLEQGAQVEEIHASLGRRSFRDTRTYLVQVGRMLARRSRGSLRHRRCPNFPTHTPYQRRLGGGQPGNDNNLKHGLYARLRPSDFEDLDPEYARTAAIEDEIVLLRVLLNRAFARAKDIHDLSLMIRMTNFVGLTCVRIAKLLKTKYEIESGGGGSKLWDDDRAKRLKEMMESVEKEL